MILVSQLCRKSNIWHFLLTGLLPSNAAAIQRREALFFEHAGELKWTGVQFGGCQRHLLELKKLCGFQSKLSLSKKELKFGQIHTPGVYHWRLGEVQCEVVWMCGSRESWETLSCWAAEWPQVYTQQLQNPQLCTFTCTSLNKSVTMSRDPEPCREGERERGH